MPIIDSQVHAYEANTPKRPWHSTPNWPPHVTGDEMVAAMDRVGVDGSIFISAFSLYQYDASYAVEVQRKHPGRFAIIKPVNPADPAVGEVIAEWKKRGFDFAGCTESFRGYDGIRTAAAAIEKAGKAEPAAIKAALWDINIKGLNGDIVFRKSGPEGKESGQSQPNVYLIEITDGKIGMKTL